MAKGDDYLELLWNEVIDPEGKKKWTTQCLKQQKELSSGPLKNAAPALLRLLEQKLSVADLETLAAFVRYEACFGVLVALDDPGLGKSKIAGIYKDFLRSRPKSRSRNKREEFIQWLWETENFADDDGSWLKDATEKNLRIKHFEKLYPAVQRLRKTVKKLSDIELFLGWNRYQACANTLRLLEETGFERGDEPVYLHEGLLEACPSDNGKKSKAGSAEATEPLWRIKAAQSLAFSPDSKTLAVAGASSPIRLYDLAKGEERLSCEGIRIHIYRIAFSPNGKQVTAGQIHKEVSVCDAKTGKLLHKLKRSEDEISGLEHAPTGELICSSWCPDIAVFDSQTGKTLPSLKVNDDDVMVDAISLAAKGGSLAVLCDGVATIWSWPERKQLLELKVGGWECKDISFTDDGKLLAVSEQDKGIHLFDTARGRRVGLIKVKDLYQGLAFTPDSSHLIVNERQADLLSIWRVNDLKAVGKLAAPGGVFDLDVSPDGNFLAAATGRGALVWRLKPLLG